MQSRPGSTESTRVRAWLGSRGRGSRRLRLAAYGLSAALHVIAILLYTSVMEVIQPEAATFPIPTDSGTEQGVPLIRLIDIDAADPDRPEDPADIEDIIAAEAEASAPTFDDAPIGVLLPPGPTLAELLQPNLDDPRLWAAQPPEFYELSIKEQEELLVSARIVEWYDSVALARAAEDRLTDWTFRDSNGGRWGVADGRIYLGDVALPLPINFGVPVGKRDETNYRIWEFEEIQRQSQRFIIEQAWKERAAATRARRDRERAAARDTIRSR